MLFTLQGQNTREYAAEFLGNAHTYVVQPTEIAYAAWIVIWIVIQEDQS
jgi:hypothetical protein